MAGKLKSCPEIWRYQNFAYLCGVDGLDLYIVHPSGCVN